MALGAVGERRARGERGSAGTLSKGRVRKEKAFSWDVEESGAC